VGDPAVGDVDQASGGALDLGAADLASGDLALSPWKLTWSDEFDGPAGAAIDGAKWKFDVGTGSNGWGNGELQYYTNRTSNVALSDGYHVYAIEWEPNQVRWYVDDKLYETRTPADVPAGATWVYDHPFFVILNLAVGGSFPGPPDGTTVFPQTTKVDYVRVYA